MAVPDTDKVPESNMTPMIDVVFQLLIFFMLSMHFPEIEGVLKTQLPKDRGPGPWEVRDPELAEIRVILCAGGDVRTHPADKGRHEKQDKDDRTCAILVEGIEIGRVHLTAQDEGKAARNRETYRNAGAKIRELYDLSRSTRDPSKRAPVIIDTDSETPYEHVLGIVNALKDPSAGVREQAAWALGAIGK